MVKGQQCRDTRRVVTFSTSSLLIFNLKKKTKTHMLFVMSMVGTYFECDNNDNL